MGNYKNNPKKPYEVRVPNRIRKHIAMHETESFFHLRMESASTRLRKTLAMRTKPYAPKLTGSMWSRFTSGIKNFIQNKPCGGRK